MIICKKIFISIIAIIVSMSMFYSNLFALGFGSIDLLKFIVEIHLDNLDSGERAVGEIINDIEQLGMASYASEYKSFLTWYDELGNDTESLEQKNRLREVIRGISLTKKDINHEGFTNITQSINELLTGDSQNDDGIKLFFGLLEFLYEKIQEPVLFDEQENVELIRFNDLKEFTELTDDMNAFLGSFSYFKNREMGSIGGFLKKIEQLINDFSTDEIREFKQELSRIYPGIYTETTYIMKETTKVLLNLEYDLYHEGKASYLISNEQLESLLKEAKKIEGMGKIAIIQIDANMHEMLNEANIQIPRKALAKIADETNSNVRICLGIANFTLDKISMSNLGSKTENENITISVAKAEEQNETIFADEKLKTRPVYEFVIKTSNGNKITNFDGGKITVGIPYELSKDEKPNAIIVFYINNNGQKRIVRGRFVNKLEEVQFTTTHFSKYAIGYNQVDFDDVLKNQWFKDAIDFVAARKIARGVGEKKFGPNINITRAQALMMIMNAYGIDVDIQTDGNFIDAGDTYYTSHLAVAKKLKITSGIGNNMFAPEREITRQELFTFLFNLLKAIDELPQLSGANSLQEFTDANEVAKWAIEPLDMFIATGVVKGYDLKISPKTIATRAQMAQILYILSK